MLTILNLAIGLSFVFLLFSLTVSALNEIWLSFLDQRTRFLREGIRELFHEYPGLPLPTWFQSLKAKISGKSPNDVPAPTIKGLTANDQSAEEADSSLLDKFYAHGLISSLSRGENGRPAYIGADMFMTAVVDIVRSQGTGDDVKSQILSGIAKIKESNPAFAQALNALFQKVNLQVDAFENEVSNWFNTSMERVSGWYKRYAQQWLLVLSLILAVACNVDTIHIITVLSTDPKALQATVDEATSYVKANPSAANASSNTETDKTLDTLLKNANNALTNLNSATVPIGWNSTQISYFYEKAEQGYWFHVGRIFSAVFGWFLTALAASLGAPFWFDTLNRFINIRGNGRSPDEK